MRERREIAIDHPDPECPALSAADLPRHERELLDPVHFLIGAERSGTTLLRPLLDHHPEIAWCSEFEYSVDKLPAGEGFSEMDGYIRWLKRDRIFRLHGWSIDRDLSYPELMDSFLRQKRGDKEVAGATVHRSFHRLLRIWPHARFIYLLRDGRDVARSWIAMGWAGNMWSAMEEWLKAEQQWMKLRATLPEDRWIEVRYEDLVTEPVGSLSRICRFLGTEFDEAMFGYARVPGTTYAFPDPKLAQQWKNKQSQEEIRQAEARAGGFLLARGYELSGLPPLEITPELERAWRRQNRIAKLKHRLSKFGWSLTVGETISRRLRLDPLQHYCMGRINRMIDANLKR